LPSRGKWIAPAVCGVLVFHISLGNIYRNGLYRTSQRTMPVVLLDQTRDILT